jgi:large conductance mechanosensitive channel
MAILLIILGVVLALFGSCNLLQAVGDTNATRQVGGAVIGLALLIPGILALVYGIKRAGRSKGETGNTRKCPHCAEMIKPDATVCRFCNREVPEPPPMKDLY